MSTVVISRRRNNDPGQPKAIPGNPFQIKEGNTQLFLKEYIKRSSLTSGFSGTLEVLNNTPDNESLTLDFVGETLSTSQENDVVSIVETFRDKAAYTVLDQLNIDRQDELQESFEQIGDLFDEDNINELVIPDFLGIRAEFEDLYNNNPWDSFGLGEKRILISDWAIGSINERLEIFPGSGKRNSIYKLFSSKLMNLNQLEFTRRLIEDLSNHDNGRLTELIEAALAPSKLRLQKFISRSNAVSADAGTVSVEIPIFSNVRNTGSFLNVLSDTRAVFTRDAECDVSYNVTVQAPGNSNFRITGCVESDSVVSDIDNNMKAEERGRGNVYDYRRASFSEGDEIFIKLEKQGAGGNGSITAKANMCNISIEEII